MSERDHEIAVAILEFCIIPRTSSDVLGHLSALGYNAAETKRVLYSLRNPRREYVQKLLGTSRDAVYGTTKLGKAILKRVQMGGKIL